MSYIRKTYLESEIDDCKHSASFWKRRAAFWAEVFPDCPDERARCMKNARSFLTRAQWAQQKRLMLSSK